MSPSTIGVRLTQVLLVVVTVAIAVHFHVIEHGVVLLAYGN